VIAVLIFLATSNQASRVAALFGWLATASIAGVIVFLVRNNQERQIGQPAHHLMVFAMLAGFGYVLGEVYAKNRLRPP
jgi:predicted HAD superfamily phosphohydrolase YqeG